MRCLILVFCLLFFGCKTDSSKISLPETESTESLKKSVSDPLPTGKAAKKNFPEPEMQTISSAVSSKIPQKDEWELVATHTIENAELSGVAVVDGKLLLYSDTTNSSVKMLDLDSGIEHRVLENGKVIYLHQRVARVIMPIFDWDSVFVYRGTPKLHKLYTQIPLSSPTGFDGFRIDDWTIVDRGNNRLVHNRGKEYRTIGGPGSGPGEFRDPSCLMYLGNSFYVTDTGNKRVQAYSAAGTYLTSFGQGELLQPGGLATDGYLLFVCDEELNKIFVYNQDGKLFYKLDKDIEDPRDIYFAGGKLYVTDARGQIKVFTHPIY